MATKTMVLTPAGIPPSAGAKLEITEISHDLREEEGLHAALDALQALAVITDEVLTGIMVGSVPCSSILAVVPLPGTSLA